MFTNVSKKIQTGEVCHFALTEDLEFKNNSRGNKRQSFAL